MDYDQFGFPVVAPPAGLKPKAPVPPPAESPALAPSTRPAGINSLEWARRGDAVRDAAREMEPLSPQDLKERLRGVTTKPLTDAELAQFTVDVRAATLDDLADILDQQQRGRLRTRRTVRVLAPRGYVVKTLKGLTSAESSDLESRLRSRGWTDADVKAKLPQSPPSLVPQTPSSSKTQP